MYYWSLSNRSYSTRFGFSPHAFINHNPTHFPVLLGQGQKVCGTNVLFVEGAIFSLKNGKLLLGA
jgi:hypothetical protein